MSTKNAGSAVKLGYTNVKVMLAGVPAWKKTGNHVVASQSFVKKGNIVLVDLRSKKDYQAGHIPRAHNISLEDLEYAEDDFPSNKAVPIVVYGNGGDAKAAYKMIKGWGKKKGSISGVSFAAWKKAGNPIETGVTPEEIVWKRILGKNEVSIPEFRKASLANPLKVIILDVRTNDEVAEGKLRDAVHIPLDELGKKANILDKNKDVLVHCTTGARAEMAVNELKRQGFSKVRYLLANIEIDEGECECEE